MGVWSLSKMEMDAIGEIMSISMGASASAVSSLLGKNVRISTPMVKVQTKDEFEFKDLEPAISVDISYAAGLQGRSILMFRKNDLRLFVAMLNGQEPANEEFVLDEMTVSAVCEVMNQMMGASATSLSEFLGKKIRISEPKPMEVKDEESFKTMYFDDQSPMVAVRFMLDIEGKVKSTFLNLMPIDMAKTILEPFAADITEKGGEIPVQPERIEEGARAQEQSGPAQDSLTQQLLMQMQQTQQQIMNMMQNNMTQNTQKEDKRVESNTVIRPISPGELVDEGGPRVEDKANQEMLMQLPLEVSVEIGRTKRLVRDILEFTQGSLVVLDKMAGEQVDLFVNGQCIAKGDIVVVEDNFGIRITEIVSRNLSSEAL